jgi:hypothetical protein
MKLEQEESWNALRRKHDVRLKDTGLEAGTAGIDPRNI